LSQGSKRGDSGMKKPPTVSLGAKLETGCTRCTGCQCHPGSKHSAVHRKSWLCQLCQAALFFRQGTRHLPVREVACQHTSPDVASDSHMLRNVTDLAYLWQTYWRFFAESMMNSNMCKRVHPTTTDTSKWTMTHNCKYEG
jgi:hypothetical protein